MLRTPEINGTAQLQLIDDAARREHESLADAGTERILM